MLKKEVEVGKYLELKTTEDGWEYVSRVNCIGASMVLVYHRDKEKYLMVEQYRPPVKCRVLEWPAGLIDEGEDPVHTAVRELYEETGVKISQEDLISLGTVFAGVGISSEKVYLYAAEIDSSFQIDKPEVQGAEIKHGLVSRYVDVDELLQTKAAKALTVFARYQAKKNNPELIFHN